MPRTQGAAVQHRLYFRIWRICGFSLTHTYHTNAWSFATLRLWPAAILFNFVVSTRFQFISFHFIYRVFIVQWFCVTTCLNPLAWAIWALLTDVFVCNARPKDKSHRSTELQKITLKSISSIIDATYNILTYFVDVVQRYQYGNCRQKQKQWYSRRLRIGDASKVVNENDSQIVVKFRVIFRFRPKATLKYTRTRQTSNKMMLSCWAAVVKRLYVINSLVALPQAKMKFIFVIVDAWELYFVYTLIQSGAHLAWKKNLP